MKDQILRMLKQNNYSVSGEDISNLLGISRTAVWKHINSLKAEGYSIDSQTKTGYRLLKSPDRLYPAEIEEFLCTRFMGREIFYFDSVGSTNTAARDAAENGAGDGAVVFAEQQTAGKGRLGRAWHAPFQTGIWMSVVLRPDMMPADAPKITLAAANAVAGALKELGFNPGIKWPNDIVLNQKKVCGILTEMKSDMDRVHYVVVGMGINVNNSEFSSELKDIATSLRLESGENFNRAKVAACILNHLENSYSSLIKDGFAGIRSSWKKYSINLGHEVVVRTLTGTIEGIAEDIDEDGLLIVREADGKIKKITAGDVTLRGE